MALDGRDVRHVVRHPIQKPPAELGVHHLTAPEADRDLRLVPVLEEPADVPGLELIIVLVRLRPHLHFLDLDDRLLLARVLRPAALLVLELAEVHDPADGRSRLRSHFDQVQLPLLSDPECLGDRENAELLPLGRDDAYLSNTDPLVDS